MLKITNRLAARSTVVHTTPEPEPVWGGRYAFGACNRGLPLQYDGSCTGDCQPPQDD